MYVCAWVLYICTPYVQMPVKPEEVTRSLEAGGSCELEYGKLNPRSSANTASAVTL